MPSASILVPTHDHATTLSLSVGSALAQSVEDVEVLIIGDGVTPQVRSEARRLVESDRRVTFFDHPKGENHGESYRHDAILAARSDAIFYLCDDDLLMREHVADLLELLREHNLVQCKGGYFDAHGAIHPHPGNLADPVTIEFHLSDVVRYNSTGITGTAHSKKFYLRVGKPWGPTPPGNWPDHYQWRKLMRHRDFRGATSDRMTALQFPSSGDGRDGWDADRRRAELEPWVPITGTPEGQRLIDDLVARGDRAALIEATLTEANLGDGRREESQLRIRAAYLEAQYARRGQVLARQLADAVHRLPIVGRRRRGQG
jgi:hypothetical protein